MNKFHISPDQIKRMLDTIKHTLLILDYSLNIMWAHDGENITVIIHTFDDHGIIYSFDIVTLIWISQFSSVKHLVELMDKGIADYERY